MACFQGCSESSSVFQSALRGETPGTVATSSICNSQYLSSPYLLFLHRHVFHYIVENNITYLCLTDEAEKRRIAFAFLDDIKERFLATYGSRAQTAIAYAMNGEFGPILQERMVSHRS